MFAVGLDSLQTLHLVRRLQGAIGTVSEDMKKLITSQRIYKTPTIEKLAKLVTTLLDPNSVVDLQQDESSKKEDWGRSVQELVDKFTANLPAYVTELPKSPDTHTVLLTGSTGYIGSYILNHLLQDPGISHVYCLNRSDEAQFRTVQSFKQKGLDFSDETQSKVTFFQASFGEERFGLSDTQYTQIMNSITLIIHNAWKVDFNHPLESFEGTHIRGVKRLIDFTMQAAYLPHLTFISSLSAVESWDLGPSCPEIIMDNVDVALKSGYGLSKYTAERILAVCAEKCGLFTTIIRVGQIGGPTIGNGFWSLQDWIPAIVKTSKSMKKVPDSLSYMPIDWVPVVSISLGYLLA